MKKLSTKEMKEVAYKIISNELEEYTNMEIYVSPVTNFEYYTNYIGKFIKFYTDNELYLGKNKFLELIKRPFNNTTIAYTQHFVYSEEDKKTGFINFICILIDKIKKDKHSHIELLRACYHEARHSIQLNFDINSYACFLHYAEGVLINNNYTNYNKSHDNYSIEIGANLYGIFKTEDFLKNKYPDVYKLEKGYIKGLETSFKLDYMLYDAVGQMNKALELVNKKSLKINDEIPIFNIFMGDDNSFKSINDIIKNPNFEKIDKRIVYTVLSSDLFLNSIDIEKLSDIELTTLNEALQYTYTIYSNQYKFIWEKFNNEEINFKFFIESAKRLIKNIKEIDKHLLLLNNAKENKRQQFSKNIKLK